MCPTVCQDLREASELTTNRHRVGSALDVGPYTMRMQSAHREHMLNHRTKRMARVCNAGCALEVLTLGYSGYVLGVH